MTRQQMEKWFKAVDAGLVPGWKKSKPKRSKGRIV